MARTRHLDFDEGADSSRFVTALARGLDVLACFHVDEKWLTNAEIASRTGLPKPTVVRMAYTLCVLGYLRQSHESGKYALGDSVAALGITMVSNLKLRRIARPGVAHHQLVQQHLSRNGRAAQGRLGKM